MLVRFALAATLLVFLGVVGTASAILLQFGSWDPGHIDAPVDPADSGEPLTILVLGSDRRFSDSDGTPARSDTMMLVRLDPDRGTTSALSLPRDLKVNIPGHGTDKLNAAYAFGGEKLTIKTIKQLLAPHSPDGRFAINHVINVNFGGFQRAVNHFNCLYIDVDKQYFNDNNPPAGGGGNYASINVPAGYQRLCGQDSLDYVRYRHFDSDLVRSARQQEFLRQAKSQVGVDQLIADHTALLKILSDYVQTDITGTSKTVGVLKTVVSSAKHPLQEVPFPAASTGDFVTADDAGLDRAVRRLLAPKTGSSAKSPTERAKPASRATQPAAVVAAAQEGEDQAIALAPSVGMPVLYPEVATPDAQYMGDQSRAYVIKDRQNHKFQSYRIVVKTRLVGQYYGIQGTKWPDPPILDDTNSVLKIGKRSFRVYKDGRSIRMIALATKAGTYWVSNTLSLSLSNAQMRAIASSLGPIGSK